MKTILVAALVILMAGCASAPYDHDKMVRSSCAGSTANAQGVVISPLVKDRDRDFVYNECLRQHGVAVIAKD